MIIHFIYQNRFKMINEAFLFVLMGKILRGLENIRTDLKKFTYFYWTLTIKITEEMPIVYDIETDYLYLRGIEKGIEKEKAALAQNLILETDFTNDKIASLANVTVDFVEKLREKLKKK